MNHYNLLINPLKPHIHYGLLRTQCLECHIVISFPVHVTKNQSQQARQPLPQTAPSFNKNAKGASSSWATPPRVLCSRKTQNYYLPQIHFKYYFSNLYISQKLQKTLVLNLYPVSSLWQPKVAFENKEEKKCLQNQHTSYSLNNEVHYSRHKRACCRKTSCNEFSVLVCKLWKISLL